MIDSILDAGRLAPTAVNRQPVHVWAIVDEEMRSRLTEATKYTFGAPVVFIIGADKKSAWVRKNDGKNSAEIDASIVCTHMMLEVADLGLGSTWVGSFDEEIVKKILPQTADYEVLALLPVGHPADGASANHDIRIEMEKFATII